MIWLGPEPRDPLAALDADPSVSISSTGSWLNAEQVSDQ